MDYASRAITNVHIVYIYIYLIMGYQFDGLLLNTDQIFSP